MPLPTTDAAPGVVSAGKADEGAEEQGGEAGGAAGPVNKAAAEKADKLVRLSEREQAEGRTGGQAGQRIVYDDAAIDRLLDRCTFGPVHRCINQLLLTATCVYSSQILGAACMWLRSPESLSGLLP